VAEYYQRRCRSTGYRLDSHRPKDEVEARVVAALEGVNDAILDLVAAVLDAAREEKGRRAMGDEETITSDGAGARDTG
jgi:hypothetical protein